MLEDWLINAYKRGVPGTGRYERPFETGRWVRGTSAGATAMSGPLRLQLEESDRIRQRDTEPRNPRQPAYAVGWPTRLAEPRI